MKLSSAAFVAENKIREYLLKKLPQNDKSIFLASAGYMPVNWQVLLNEIAGLTARYEATLTHSTLFGDVYELRGTLIGPNGKKLDIVSIWMKERDSGQTKFITLFPAREG
jgi:hypothetical protein